MKKILVLFSGGLDSLLSAKILQEKGYQVEAVHFQNPFSKLKPEKIKEIISPLNLKLHLIKLGNDYLQLVENPRFGYGKRANPCLDCRIFLLKKASRLAKKLGFDYLATGEVIGQRPFSQRKQALALIEREAGLQGKIIRPLVQLGIQGRSRKKQLTLAKKYGLTKFLSPAGGCLLTDPGFSQRLRDFWQKGGRLSLSMVELLKLGRHFWLDKNKVVVGRDEKENEKLKNWAQTQNWWWGEVKDFPSPIAVVLKKEKLQPASALLVKYSDAPKGKKVTCLWQKNKKRDKILVVK